MEVLLLLFGSGIAAALSALGIYAKYLDREQEKRAKRLLKAAPEEPPVRVLPPAPAIHPWSREYMEKERRRTERRRRAERKAEATRRLQEELERREQEHEEALRRQERRIREEMELAAWRRERLAHRIAAEQVAQDVEEANLVQAHEGRNIEVIASVVPTGAMVSWHVTGDWDVRPWVLATCGKDIMFRECGIKGRHVTRLPPGRHVLAFWVDYDGPPNVPPDLMFEIFISSSPPRLPNAFRQKVNKTRRTFIDRNATLARAKRKIRESLEARGADQDEIDLELAKFEGELREEDVGERP